MGRLEADIALESCLFGFRPCSGQGQFTLPTDHFTLNKFLAHILVVVWLASLVVPYLSHISWAN